MLSINKKKIFIYFIKTLFSIEKIKEAKRVQKKVNLLSFQLKYLYKFEGHIFMYRRNLNVSVDQVPTPIKYKYLDKVEKVALSCHQRYKVSFTKQLNFISSRFNNDSKLIQKKKSSVLEILQKKIATIFIFLN